MPHQREWRKRMLWLLWGFGGLLLLALLSVAWQVEDWNRDLTHNHAQTISDGPDPGMRNLQTVFLPEEAAKKSIARLITLPGWKFEKQETLSPGYRLHFTRRTRWLGFVDDVWIVFLPTNMGSELSAESRSRIGRGDLGQNPRNLRELIATLQEELREQ